MPSKAIRAMLSEMSTSAPRGRLSQVRQRDQRSLIIFMGEEDCALEMGALKDVARVLACKGDLTTIKPRVLGEVFGLFVWDTLVLDRKRLKRLKKLKVIVCMGSVGIGNIDCLWIAKMGVALSYLPFVSCAEVAETTICYLLNLYRRTAQSSRAIKCGQMVNSYTNERRAARGSRCLTGSVLGIIGMGKIGRAVASRVTAFGLKVIYYDPFLTKESEASLNYERKQSLWELLQSSQCVSLHCTFNTSNKYMINKSTLSMMLPGAFLINTAHGGLVREEDLSVALKLGALGGAALDVFDRKHFGLKSSPLRDAPNLICTPHTAWYTEDGLAELRQRAAMEMRRAITGPIPDSLDHCINLHDFPSPTSCPSPIVPPPFQRPLSPASLLRCALANMPVAAPLSPLTPPLTTWPHHNLEAASHAMTAFSSMTQPAGFTAPDVLMMKPLAQQVSYDNRASYMTSRATALHEEALAMANEHGIGGGGGQLNVTAPNRIETAPTPPALPGDAVEVQRTHTNSDSESAEMIGIDDD